jgi:hypothetical protein
MHLLQRVLYAHRVVKVFQASMTCQRNNAWPEFGKLKVHLEDKFIWHPHGTVLLYVF